jgi:ribosomal protein S4
MKSKPKSKTPKKRLDVLVVERGLAESRERAQAMILAGQVRVNQQGAVKAGARWCSPGSRWRSACCR